MLKHILSGKSLVSNFDQAESYNAHPLDVDVPLYQIYKVSLFLILERLRG